MKWRKSESMNDYMEGHLSARKIHWVFIVLSHKFKKMVAASISNFAALHSLKKCGLPTASPGAALKIHLGSVTVPPVTQHIGTCGSWLSVPPSACRRPSMKFTHQDCVIWVEWIYFYIICCFIFINWRPCNHFWKSLEIF